MRLARVRCKEGRACDGIMRGERVGKWEGDLRTFTQEGSGMQMRSGHERASEGFRREKGRWSTGEREVEDLVKNLTVEEYGRGGKARYSRVHEHSPTRASLC